MNIGGKIKRDSTYDAIVIGSGISGGWACQELCRSGLKTLLLERGRNVEHIKDYNTALLNPWELENRGNLSEAYKQMNPIQSTGVDESTRLFFADDQNHPYIQDKPFFWYRGYQVGGRSLTWGRQCYRLSDLDFEANLKEGIAIDWPIRYADIAAWYDYVESAIGVSGSMEGISHLPDGKFVPPFELNCIEKHLAASIQRNDEERRLVIARVANLTKGLGGRGPCLTRNLCDRGCPYGGYFSSNSSTIPAAIDTGNLTLRPFSIVSEIIYDDASKKASGVRVIDSISFEIQEFYANVIFLNASAINSAAILLQSKSQRFPDGMGNDSGQVGHNLMDHHSSAGATGTHDGFKEFYYKGRRPCGFIIPRFRNVGNKRQQEFLRGYNIQGDGERKEWRDLGSELRGFGRDFKEKLTKPGDWTVWMAGWGECLPYFENRIYLEDARKDKWGIPLIHVNFSFRENEEAMMKDIEEVSADMLSKAGFRDVETFNYGKPGGATVHEMGTARMGQDPKSSVLNGFNQIHSVKNVFITDGSCMTSSASQHPSLTYMALTARACNYAVNSLKKGLF